MIRKSHLLLALALAAAAFAAPIAQSQDDQPSGTVTVPAWLSKIHYPGTSYPFNSVGIPASLARTHYPGTSVVTAPAAQKPVDPFAVSYLIGRGLSPSEVVSWTSGTCSHEKKAASCYAMFDRAPAASSPVSRSVGFQWADAGIGAGFALGVVLLLGGVAAGLLISRNGRGSQAARA